MMDFRAKHDQLFFVIACYEDSNILQSSKTMIDDIRRC